MITKHQVISQLINFNNITQDSVSAFAPSNIALIKYWGKRNVELNLPTTSSLSIDLGQYGAHTNISISEQNEFFVNKNLMSASSPFSQRLAKFLQLFSQKSNYCFKVTTEVNLPIAAGLASSACGFAAITLALNKLFNWQLSKEKLSIIARLGSGSASRSLYSGFVKWHAGIRDDGFDCIAQKLPIQWPEFSTALLIVSPKQKKINSTKAMQHVTKTSPFYGIWPQQVIQDLQNIEQYLHDKNFTACGQLVEQNALAMHALNMAARPAIVYSTAETIKYIHKIWQLRHDGLEIYFSQDAGANLKLFFLAKDRKTVQEIFPESHIILRQE